MENRKIEYIEEPVKIIDENVLKDVKKKRHGSGCDTCVCCGEIIPEGRMICPSCENGTYRKAIRHYGRDEQIVVAIEEMSELTKELTKNYRGKNNIDAIAEEICDVEVMLEQLKQIFDCRENVAQIKKIKLARLHKRIDYENRQFDLR